MAYSNFMNPYTLYPVGYANQMGYAGMMQPQQQSYAAQPQPPVQQPKIMEWVEGEVGAKAYQMPAGWPANQPIPLWDSTDTVIWLKSWGPMGIPNPMQKLRYEMPEQQNQPLLAAGNGQSGASQPIVQQPDMSQYVTKSELEQMRDEIRKMQMQPVQQQQNQRNQNQNGSNNGQNRGGN